MNPYFNISYSCTSMTERPPISYKVREYLEDFIVENLLKKKKIIIGTKWRVDLSISFIQESARYKSDYIFTPKGAKTVSSEGVKIFEVLVPLKLIKEAENPHLKAIELTYESVASFFTREYKKITLSLMTELWNSVDKGYLLSLPYPAPLIDQKYVSDLVTAEGKVENIIQWSAIQSR
jgi:hypothetical protein